MCAFSTQTSNSVCDAASGAAGTDSTGDRTVASIESAAIEHDCCDDTNVAAVDYAHQCYQICICVRIVRYRI
jgi:hypothetical protein